MMRLRGAALPLLACACIWPGAGTDPLEPVDERGIVVFAERISAFYGRLENMPLNSLTAFEDPELRSYFDGEREFSDYFASVAAQVRDSFARQGVMGLIGARLGRIEPGMVEIELPFRPDLTQQHGFFHAGVTSTIADSAGGYAAFSLFSADSSVLTVEYKINLIAPADGDRLVAIGKVVKPGRTLTVCTFEVVAEKNGAAKTCAVGQQTIMCLAGRPDTA